MEDVQSLQAAELALLEQLREAIPTRVMIDVGAHHGHTLAPFLEAGWQVYAFEPIAANRAVMQRRWPNCPRLILRPEAVSDSSGTRTMHLALRDDGTLHDYHHSLEDIGDHPQFQKGPTVPVPAVSLNDLAARGELPRQVGFLKIDTEGHDAAVLRGASEIAATVVCVEFWCDGLFGGRCPSPPEQMVALMATRGYSSYLAVIHDGPRTRYQWSFLQGLTPTSWGNLFFFHETEPAVAAAVRQMRLGTTVAAPDQAAPVGRLPRLLQHAFSTRRPLVFYDIGAYQGDFAADMLRWFPDAQGLAFEPTPATFEELKRRFSGESRLQLHPLALSDTPGTANYYLTDRPYNNSLLPPSDHAVQATATVQVATVDQLRQQDGRPVALLKIDAQGHDLHILRGAAQTLRQDRPAVLVEATFIPMYQQQDDYAELLIYMRQMDYQLSGQFLQHATPDGLLAYADWLFLPAEVHARLVPPRRLERYVCGDSDALQEMNRLLETACEERLELVRQLQAVNTAREQLLQEQNRLIMKLSQPSVRQAVRMLLGALRRSVRRRLSRLRPRLPLFSARP